MNGSNENQEKPTMTVSADQHIESPCTNECNFTGDSGLCTGCFRTMDEIMNWWSLSQEERRRVVDRVRLRGG
jgi:predicted Fe-S protein YdhL (DUF1289 family)